MKIGGIAKLKGVGHDLRLIFFYLKINFSYIKWYTCTFWLIDQTLNVIIQVLEINRGKDSL